MLLRICETLIYPQEIKTESKSKPGKIHSTITRTLFNDSICTCKGYLFNGTCSHIKGLDETRCTFAVPANQCNVEVCPFCSSDVIEYELNPEYD